MSAEGDTALLRLGRVAVPGVATEPETELLELMGDLRGGLTYGETNAYVTGMAVSASHIDVPSGDIAHRHGSRSARGGSRTRPADSVVAGTRSKVIALRLEWWRSGGSRGRLPPEVARDSRGLGAHGGCVWCVTVKDPRRCRAKRQPGGLAMPPERASDHRTGAARSDFWTSRSCVRSRQERVLRRGWAMNTAAGPLGCEDAATEGLQPNLRRMHDP